MVSLTPTVSSSKSKSYKAQKVQQYALNSQQQALQILTNDEVENWSFSSFLLALLTDKIFSQNWILIMNIHYWHKYVKNMLSCLKWIIFGMFYSIYKLPTTYHLAKNLLKSDLLKATQI